MISQRAVDLIVSCEVSSRAAYEKIYHRPEWPGGRSGITVGIGYDLGYATPAKVRADFGPHLPAAMIDVMVRCCGLRGENGRAMLSEVRGQIDVPWDEAMAVFLERDIPEWTAAVERAIPAAANLPGDCKGAVVSLAYNRGASFNEPGDRYAEMRAIKDDIQANHDDHVPLDFRHMERLWPDVRGLRDRREAEAKLWEAGLANPAPAPASHTATESPKPALPPAPAGLPEHGPAGGTLAGTATAAHNAASSGHSWWIVAAIVIGGIAVAALIWYSIRTYRISQPVTARAKDAPDPVPAN